MTKKLVVISCAMGVILSLGLLMSSCSNNELDRISGQLNINITNGKVIESSDSHGGFLGDGLYFTSISFSNNDIRERISDNLQWKSLPLDKTTEIIVYGIENEDIGDGPYLTQGGEALFPPIQNGYYLLIDKQEGQTAEILDRASLNIVVALFDNDTNILYYCEFDT